jgi:hypothetical protein
MTEHTSAASGTIKSAFSRDAKSEINPTISGEVSI